MKNEYEFIGKEYTYRIMESENGLYCVQKKNNHKLFTFINKWINCSDQLTGIETAKAFFNMLKNRDLIYNKCVKIN